MIKLSEMTKDTKINNADYILDKQDKLKSLMSCLYRKIEGDWYIALIEPKLEFVRELLDMESIPSYVKLEIFIEPKQLTQILMERPKLCVKKVSFRDKVNNLIIDCPCIVDSGAVSELCFRLGNNITAINDALTLLCEKAVNSQITRKDVRLYIPENNNIYASNVVYNFLTDSKNKWESLIEYENLLGTEIAFYAIRKYMRKLIKEKDKYLHNKDIKMEVVKKIDALSISKMYSLIEASENFNQLIPIFIAFEGGLNILKEEEEETYAYL